LLRSIRRAFAPQNLITTAVVGLCVAGVAAAAIGSAQITNNSIRGIDIKNGSVGSADITNNSLRSIDVRNGGLLGRDLKNNSVTGNQVRESTLGKVPSAISADAATSAANADKLNGLSSAAFVPSGDVKRVSLRLNVGDPDVTVAENGSIKVYGRCFNSGGQDRFALFAASTVNGAVLLGDADTLDANPTALDTTTLETDREVVTESTATGTKSADTNYDQPSMVYSADGTKVISISEGVGGMLFNYFGKTCSWDGESILAG
jgi:hypothetical protein